MPLPYSEKTSDLEYAIQRLSGAQMIALTNKLTDQPITPEQKIELDRIRIALENPTPYKPEK